ncbi:DNA ligase 1-like [Clytia hemisphaerica]|uniref:DNA ligase 1-like n=1 Tax=Clytia hemisphaerica TaxID=252671 RepID=UPI0034D5C61C
MFGYCGETDETLVIIGKQLPTNEEDTISLRSSLSDGSSDEDKDEDEKLLDSSRLRTPAEQQGLLSQQGFEIEAVGIGSVVYFPPVENTIFAKGRPLPKIEKKGPHPWSYQLSDDKKEHTAAQVDPKPTASRPLPRIEEHRSNVKLNKTVKDSMDSGIDEFADEANEEIERAMRAACGRKIPAKKNNKKREEWLLCQTPNLEKGPSGFSWQLDHKLTGPCHRASTPRPQLTSSTLRPMKRRTVVEISLGQELAQKKRDQLIELRNTKIHDRQERFLGSQETKELDHEVHKQKLINDQREKERHLKERLEIAKQKKPKKGSTDAKLAFARQRRQQQAKLENQGKKSTVGNVQVSSTKAAGFRSNTQKSKKVFVSFQAYEDTPLPALLQAKDTSTGPKNTSGSNMRVHTPGPVNSRVMGLIKKPKVKQMPADKPVKKVPSLTLANRTKISRAVSFERVSSPVHSNAYEATREQRNAHLKKVISDIDVNAKAPAQKMVPPLLKSAPVQKRFPVAMTMKEAIRKAEEARKEREEQEKERKQREKEEDQQYWKEFDKDWNDFYSLDEEEQQIESSSTDYTEYEF